MDFEVHHHEEAVWLTRGNDMIRLQYGRNQHHFHPRVLRLSFEVNGDWELLPLGTAVRRLVMELQSVQVDPTPLLYRTTVAADSRLHEALESAGFLESRRVYEPLLTLDEVGQPALTRSTDADINLVPLAEATKHVPTQDLVAMYVEIYARISRLDPATPERIDEVEWEKLVLKDPNLMYELTCCAVTNEGLAGMATIYRGPGANHYELGPFGVQAARLPKHQELTLAMVHRCIEWIRQRGGVTLSAEIDSDDPWTLYTLADLPFRPGPVSVSLVKVPAWGEFDSAPSSAAR